MPDPRFYDTCASCGGRKAKVSARCASCYAADRATGETCKCGCGEKRPTGRYYVVGHRPPPKREGPNGYVIISMKAHPLADKHGRVLEHRKVLHDAGVEIPPGYQVHHKNGDKKDNRVENLEVLTPLAHTRRHAAERGYVKNHLGAWPYKGAAA